MQLEPFLVNMQIFYLGFIPFMWPTVNLVLRNNVEFERSTRQFYEVRHQKRGIQTFNNELIWPTLKKLEQGVFLFFVDDESGESKRKRNMLWLQASMTLDKQIAGRVNLRETSLLRFREYKYG